MGGAINIRRVATLGAALAMLASAAWAEPHEPLARFFEQIRPAPLRPLSSERRQARPAPPPAAAAPQVAAARRSAGPAAGRPDFVVGVFGDAFASSVARGLDDADASEPGRDVVDASADDASLTSTDAATWDKAVDAARGEAGRLDAAVLLVGRNDAAPMTDSHGQLQAVGSPGWRQLYGDRVAAVADRFRDRHVPLIWVGLPIVRDPAEAQLFATLNEIVHDRAVHEGAAFVDAWQAFADENGDFSTTGPDVNGRPATLRWMNGWNFTRAGARKLASFVSPDLQRVHDRARSTRELAAVPNANPDSFDQALDIDVNQQILREAGLPSQRRPDAAETALQAKPGPQILLTAAPLAPDGRLASIDAAAPSAVEPPGGSHPGRADDFAWPGP